MWKFKMKKPTKGDELSATEGDECPGIATLLPPARCFTYNEILRMTANFSHLIGKEGFSEVYSGFEQSGLRVAVKKMKMEPYSRSQFLVYNEVEILARIHHRNLVSLVGLCKEGNELMLVYEYMAGGSLSDALLASNSELTWRKRLQIAQDAAIGLHYLHGGCNPSVIHTDVKSSHILLDENMDAKLSGFKLSNSGAIDGSEYFEISTVAGTWGYMAPEYMCTGRLSKKCDVYSFGVVLFELITGKSANKIVGAIESGDLNEWVMATLGKGDVENILDPLLKGRCNIESVWIVVRIANSAIQEDPSGRPDVSDIMSALQASVRMETSQVDMASRSEISTNQSFTEIPLSPVLGNRDAADSSSRFYSLSNIDSVSYSCFHTLPKETLFPYRTEARGGPLAMAANGPTAAETSSGDTIRDSKITITSGMLGRTTYINPTGSEPYSTSSSSTTTKAAQPNSAMEVQPSRDINETTMVAPYARRFTYNEILSITGNFGRVIGRGGFATVYYGQLQEGGLEVAVKKIKESGPEFSKVFLAEVKILMRIHHRNLVSLVGFCEERNEIILVFEYMAGGNLSTMLKGKTARASELTWKKRLQLALGTARGLEYLHTGCRPAVIHGDIKSANILLDENLEAKLADFGTSKASECSAFEVSKIAGTWGYIDPEYLWTQTLTRKSDVYSFGVVLFELITGKPAVVISETKEKLHLTNWVVPMLKRGNIEGLLDPMLQGNCNITSIVKVANIARAAAAHNPSERPDMADIVGKLKKALKMELPSAARGFETSN